MTSFGLWWGGAGHWDIFVAIYLFLGGISGGAFLVASIAEWFGERSGHEGYEYITRWGWTLSFVTIVVGSWTLLAHLSGPFLRAFMFPVKFTNWTSWMAIGTWVVVTFSLVVMARMIWATFGAEAADDPSGLPRNVLGRLGNNLFVDWGIDLLDWGADRTRPTGILKRLVQVGGVALAIMLVVYTALLLSAVGWMVPLWNETLLPPLFVASGFSAGIAMVIAVTYWQNDLDSHLVHRFGLLDDAVIVAEGVVLAGLLYTLTTGGYGAARTLEGLTSGTGLLLLVGMISAGLLLPLAISAAQSLVGSESVLASRRVTTAKFGLVIAGSFLLRFLLIFTAVQQPIIVT
ncbi:MAG: NrfD/PsrC family molybdoenzyme membrane anchor subunit [Halohasta sp.]